MGKVEPTDEECDFQTDSDKEEDEITVRFVTLCGFHPLNHLGIG